MSKLLDKIRKMFKDDKKELLKEDAGKVVSTWLKQDEMKNGKSDPLEQAKLRAKAKTYRKVQKSTGNDRLQKIEGFLKGAKHSFTDEEFFERKEEVLKFLHDLKEQKHKTKT